jgi:hypothetical protein
MMPLTIHRFGNSNARTAVPLAKCREGDLGAGRGVTAEPACQSLLTALGGGAGAPPATLLDRPAHVLLPPSGPLGTPEYVALMSTVSDGPYAEMWVPDPPVEPGAGLEGRAGQSGMCAPTQQPMMIAAIAPITRRTQWAGVRHAPAGTGPHQVVRTDHGVYAGAG